MKKVITLILFAFALSFSSTLSAQDKSYRDGSVWQVGFIKLNANMTVDYLNNLKNNWRAIHEEAVKQGVIVSYKILYGAAANPEDWDVMLMTEYKSLAAIEGADEKYEAISKKIVGGEDAVKKLNESRVSMRTIYGGKLLKEVVYK
ncbi:MAG: hypothetical protein NT040_17150 [Bacteroidetes bacterium]|nr:hypothetical protein [Bacteroidota bacterium]